MGARDEGRTTMGRTIRTAYRVAAVLVALVPAGVPGSAQTTSATPPPITLTTTPLQTIAGFGASGAWWPNDLARFPQPVRENVSDMLFSRRKLGLSMYRYNIGGGGKGVKDRTRAPQTFEIGRGVYDWTRDAAGRRVLADAKRYGVNHLTGFVNSAPARLKTNGLACGGYLAAGAEADFGRYIADVVKHLRDAEGVTLDTISPMNEPEHAFPDCHQEGMVVPRAQRAAVVSSLSDALERAGVPTSIIADESSGTQSLRSAVPIWFPAATKTRLRAIAYHTYDYPSRADLARVKAEVADTTGEPLWMTEVCCHNGTGFGQGYDPTMKSGLWLADRIWDNLVDARAESFSWWTALSPESGCPAGAPASCTGSAHGSGWNDGLLYYDGDYASDRNYRVWPTKRYYALANFSRFIRPGAIHYRLTGTGIAGVRLFATKQAGTWTLVAINHNAAPTTLRVQLPSGSYRPTGAYFTSPTANLASAKLPGISTGAVLTSSLAGQSVTTYTIATS
jgi:O-glycosyl hydrolase